MNKKRWALMVAATVLVIGYIKLFYKTYSESAVPQKADCIIALDVKRITNTLIWNSITTPSQWKMGNVFKSHPKETDWSDMVDIPDYLLPFHVSGQPANTWHVVVQIKDKEGFEKGLAKYHFQSLNDHEYISEGLGIHLFKNDNTLLVSNTITQNIGYAVQAAAELFTKKNYVPKETLAKLVNAKSHLAIHISANSFLQQDGLIRLNFDKQEIDLEGRFLPNSRYGFSENNFNYTSNALCTMGFTQPSAAVYGLLGDTAKIHISKALGISLDSMMLPANNFYSLELTAVKPRIDSAVSYTYDDNFNKVEKVIVNKVQEPAFNFMIRGAGASTVYASWQNDHTLEKTAAGELFVPMPFVKSYGSSGPPDELAITAANYMSSSPDQTSNCIFYCNVWLAKIPASLLKYLPDGLTKPLGNIDRLNIIAQKEDGHILVHLTITKKQNDLPVIGW